MPVPRKELLQLTKKIKEKISDESESKKSEQREKKYFQRLYRIAESFIKD